MTTTPPPAYDPSEPALDAVYELSAGPYRSGELHVLSFEGHEEMNGLFAFEVTFWAKDLDEGKLSTALLGQPVALAMHVPGGPVRHLRGVASDVTLEGKHAGGRHAFRLSLVPRLWLLGKRVDSRIFQDLTVREIVDAVLDEHGVAHDWNLLGKYPARQYCVQHQESDLHFVRRLLAEEGIFFSFTHPDDDGGSEPVAERLALADGVHAYAPITGDPALVYRHQSGEGAMKAEENQVLDFRPRSRVEPSAVVMRDYDFQRPLLDLTSGAPAPEAPLTDVPSLPKALDVYEHHGEYEETDADAKNAGVYLEQLRAGAREAHGLSVCRRLAPGQRFDLGDHEIEKLNASWVVTRVDHRGISPEGGTKKGARVYENRFRCVPAEVPARPARPARETRQVIESAVVVGPEGQEIFTDSFGRVKVQFHWDRQGKRNEYSSCWMRVMQAWAGTGWGFQFIPRIGMEVVVSFLGGDLDRPVVMGCLYNAIQGPSFLLPNASTRSGIRTSSTPGGGGRNEIAFEDARGSEQLYLRAQRDLIQEVGNSVTLTVGADRQETVSATSRSEVRGDREDQTGGDRREHIGGKSVFNIEQGRVVNIGGSRATRVDEDDSIKIGGDHASDIGGADVTRVGGAASRDIRGDSVTLVRGNASHVTSKDVMVVAEGNTAVSIRKTLVLSVGSVDEKTNATIQVGGGDCQATVEGSIDISVQKAIRIRSGTNAITIGPDGIKIEAESIVLSAKSISAASDKSSLDVGDKVEIRGKTVKISSADDAIIELTKDAKIDGNPALKLNSKNAAEEKDRESKAAEVAKADKVSVQLFDLQGKEVANAPYEVSFPGYINRGTAAGGIIEVPRLVGVDRCFVRWARPAAARPEPQEGKMRQEFEFEMEVYLSFDDPLEEENIKRKLHNLGHQDPRGLRHAIACFQSAIGAEEITGKVDDIKGEVELRHEECKPVDLTTATEKS